VGIEPDLTRVRAARAQIRYLDEGDFVTRRHVSQRAEINTGDCRDYAMVVRDGACATRSKCVAWRSGSDQVRRRSMPCASAT
jgi:hypothetical protein